MPSFCGEIIKQTFGTAMGSSMSVANQDVQDRAFDLKLPFCYYYAITAIGSDRIYD